MAKWVNTAVLDAAHDQVALATTQLLCTGQPTDRANALALALADVAMTGGDFTKANGDTSGRKVTVAQKLNVAIDTSGTGTHVALIDGTRLLLVTTCTSQAVTSGQSWNFPAWDYELRSPT